MKIEVVATAQQVNEELVRNKTVVVIDVLRATSVITTALFNGAATVIPVASILEAESLFADFESGTALKGGERGGIIIEGFHLGNSPFSYQPQTVAGKTVILTTTNGTLAIRNSHEAKELYAVSFLNVAVAVQQILQSANGLVIVCAGTNGFFSLDDALCAGMIINELMHFTAVETDDLGLMALFFYREGEQDLLKKLQQCKHVNYLQSIGFEKDVRYCLQANVVPVLPILCEDGGLRLVNT